ncbi:MAG: site-specific DNA-methyltransferase [Ignavibacteria bacterium]|nr:site-specific DNA-methyltransferase [Ignavibacteria bacterium]
MATHHKIIIGDSRKMSELPDESVHLVVTSPPYWQLKDYGNENQLGFHDSYEGYVNNLNLVWDECFRVLHEGCRLCINIGDQFARSVYYGRYKVIPIRTEIIKFCETVGMDYMGAVIWQKVTTTNTTGGASVMGSFPYPRNGILKIDYEFILIFKKLGDPPKVTREAKELSKLTTEEWNTYFAGHWNFGGEKQDKHLAMFPEELPRRLIRMFTFVGDTVLDPFLGSGTTSLAAKNLSRNSIGFEINPSFASVIKNKLKIAERDIFGDATFEFITQHDRDIDYSKEIARLPYRFRDPHALDKKIDPRKLKFGSKIENGDNGNTAELYTVKEIVSPILLRLNNDLTVRLLGVCEEQSNREQAIQYLETKTKGQRVYLKFDKDKHDEAGHLLAYVYLKNKTFINAHLARTGFVTIDTTRDFKFRQKFLHLQNEQHSQSHIDN